MSDLFHQPTLPRITVRLRLGSMLLDHAIICFTCLPAVYLFQNLIYPDIQKLSISEYLMFPVFVIYFCKDCVHGRSIAKRILKLSVVDYSSNVEASPIQSVIRNLSVIFWPIEVLVSFFNQERRIGDRLANTKLTYSYNPNIIVRKTNIWEMVAAISIAILFTALLFIVFSWLY
jgi:hypothetical protein